MAWVVDTSVVLDLVTGDPQFEPVSTLCLQSHLTDGLVACPISFIELEPAFAGGDVAAHAFLNGAGIATGEAWTSDDHGVGASFVERLPSAAKAIGSHQASCRRRDDCSVRHSISGTHHAKRIRLPHHSADTGAE